MDNSCESILWENFNQLLLCCGLIIVAFVCFTLLDVKVCEIGIMVCEITRKFRSMIWIFEHFNVKFLGGGDVDPQFQISIND